MVGNSPNRSLLLRMHFLLRPVQNCTCRNRLSCSNLPFVDLMPCDRCLDKSAFFHCIAIETPNFPTHFILVSPFCTTLPALSMHCSKGIALDTQEHIAIMMRDKATSLLYHWGSSLSNAPIT